MGLHALGHRFYRPALGQFLSRDPAGWIDGPNRYAYAAYSPLQYIDPEGLAKRALWSGPDKGPDGVGGELYERYLARTDPLGAVSRRAGVFTPNAIAALGGAQLVGPPAAVLGAAGLDMMAAGIAVRSTRVFELIEGAISGMSWGPMPVAAGAGAGTMVSQSVDDLGRVTPLLANMATSSRNLSFGPSMVADKLIPSRKNRHPGTSIPCRVRWQEVRGHDTYLADSARSRV